MLGSFDNSHKLNATGRPVMATLITADMEGSLSAYVGSLGYQAIKTETLCEALAVHFGIESLIGNKMVTLLPQSGVPVFMRLIEAPQAAPPSSAQAGWFALELCVQDVDSLYERLKTGDSFTPLAPPKALTITDMVYPMQCVGPSGEILYLNEVRGDVMGLDMPIAACPVDHLFIAIMSLPDMDEGVKQYAGLLDMDVKERHEIPYKTINRIYELPLETMHKLVTLGGHNFVSLEVDQQPTGAGPAKLPSGQNITTGIFMVSFIVDDISQNSGSVKQFPMLPYSGAQSGINVGSAGERIELISLNEE